MNSDDILKLISQVASQLEGPAKQVWDLLVFRIRLESGLYAVIDIVVIITGIVVAKIGYSYFKKQDWDDIYFYQAILLGSTGFIGVIAVGCLVGNILNFAIPEYVVIQQFLSAIGGSK